MKTDIKFDHVMKERSNAELIEIVTILHNDYQPNAVIAAKNELQERNLSPEALQQAEQDIATKNKEAAEKANEPLATYLKVLHLIFPAILSIFQAFPYKGDGYDRKFKESWLWTLYGVGLYLVIFIIIFIIRTLV